MQTTFKTEPALAAEPALKAFEILRARLALLGFELQACGVASFAVSRWNLQRSLADLAEVQAFADRVGATVDRAQEDCDL